MTDREKILAEEFLVRPISSFHEIDDKETREKTVREFFLEYCKNNKIDEKEALEIVERYIASRRENSVFDYEHFTDLRGIIYPERKKGGRQAPNLDDDDDER